MPYGALGLTGTGHGSGKAVIRGLEGDEPELVDVGTVGARVVAVRESGRIRLYAGREIPRPAGA